MRKDIALVDAREALHAASIYSPSAPLCLWAILLLLPPDDDIDPMVLGAYVTTHNLPNPIENASVPPGTMPLGHMRAAVHAALRPADGDNWPHNLGALHRRCVGRTVRDAYYTPRWLADAVVAAVPLEDVGILRVLDPAVGSGQFLVSIVRRLCKLRPSASVAEVIMDTCFGMDVDAGAVALARLALLHLCAVTDRPQVNAVLHEQCVCADALITPPPLRFSLVLGNPPWSRLVLRNRRADFDPATDPRRLLACGAHAWPLCSRLMRAQLSAYHFFLERLSDWLEPPHGRFALVLPDAVLTSTMSMELFAGEHAPLRLTDVWQLPSRCVWTEVLSQGVAVLHGVCRSDQDDYTFHYALGCKTLPPPTTALLCADSAQVRLHGTLCPDALFERVHRLFPTVVGTVPGLHHRLGPRTPPLQTGDTIAAEEPPWQPPETHPVAIHKGSCFHLRWLFDSYPCFPHPFLGHYTRDAHLVRSWCQWLMDPERPDVIAVPLYIDREHPARDQLRACRLPRKHLPDLTVCLFWSNGSSSTAVADFLLGFWNARIVEQLLCGGLLARSAMWIPAGTFARIPFPLPGLVEMLSKEPHPLALSWTAELSDASGGAMPSDVRLTVARELDPLAAVAWIVATAAAQVECLRLTAADVLATHWDELGLSVPAARNLCWQAFTGAASGGHRLREADLRALRDLIHPNLSGILDDATRVARVVDASVAALYDCTDVEFQCLFTEQGTVREENRT